MALHHPPHPDQPGVLHLGEQAAEALRELNHRTRHHDAITDPAELSRLLADLAVTAHRLPQLLNQLRSWLQHEHDADRVRADTNLDPAQPVSLAAAQLTRAGQCAHHLADAIDNAQQHAAHLATA